MMKKTFYIRKIKSKTVHASAKKNACLKCVIFQSAFLQRMYYLSLETTLPIK